MKPVVVVVVVLLAVLSAGAMALSRSTSGDVAAEQDEVWVRDATDPPEVDDAPARPSAPVLPLVPPHEPGGPVIPPAPEPQEDDRAAEEAAQVQRRLAELSYYAGPVDGLLGPATITALQAFQKVQGLTVDGQIGPDTLAALRSPVGVSVAGGDPDRIEIDLDRQVMAVYLGGQLARIMPVSTGNGDPYDLPGGVRAESLTPAGSFQVERRIRGNVDAHFGRLSDPMYFHQGWAIHGSGNVPPTPASHGCVRLPRPDAEWLFEVSDVGMQVLVFGELNAFRPALGETAGTTTPAGEVVRRPAPPPPPPPVQGFD